MIPQILSSLSFTQWQALKYGIIICFSLECLQCNKQYCMFLKPVFLPRKGKPHFYAINSGAELQTEKSCHLIKLYYFLCSCCIVWTQISNFNHDTFSCKTAFARTAEPKFFFDTAIAWAAASISEPTRNVPAIYAFSTNDVTTTNQILQPCSYRK